MEYKNIRITKDTWKKISHLAIELDMSLGETIKYLYNFNIRVLNKEKKEGK
jgi:macrodomain Ter protein organizer (MatP/YcbG family)